jgi:enoyl-CoA hydratase/carnithine racemase
MPGNLIERGLDGPVAILRLNRPAQRNAMDTAMLELLLGALDVARGDTAVRALVLSTTSTEALSAGADLGEQVDHGGAVHRMNLFARFYEAVVDFPKPTVAVCVGATVGGGAEMAAGCDVRIAGDNLGLRFPGAAIGVPVGPARLTPLVGPTVALDWLLSSRTVGAEEARDAGFVSRIVTPEQAEGAAVEWAQAAAGFDPRVVHELRAAVRGLAGMSNMTRAENARLRMWQVQAAGPPQYPTR